MKPKKGDRVHIRVYNPVLDSVICRAFRFDEENHQVVMTLQDGTLKTVPAHTVHHIYSLSSAHKIHLTRNIEIARHEGIYKGSKSVGGLRYLAFQIPGVNKSQLSYFLAAHVSISSYEEAKL